MVSTLPDDAYQQATHFLANWLKRNKIFSVYFYVKIRPPIMAHHIPRDHNLNKIEPKLPVDSFTQVINFLAN